METSFFLLYSLLKCEWLKNSIVDKNHQGMFTSFKININSPEGATDVFQ